MVEVYAIKIDNIIEKEKFDSYLKFVSKEKRLKINKFHKFEDAQRSLISDILLRTIISEKLHIINKDIIFRKNDYGKPFLGSYVNFEFNISHSMEWVVCAFSDKFVGIDIERIADIDLNIAKRFFSKIEYRQLLNKDSSQRLSFFYDLWTLKESYIKAVGKGLSIPLNSFSIIFRDDLINIDTENELKNCYFKQYNIDANYKMAVCSCDNNFCSEVIYIKVNDIFDKISLICQ